MIALEVMATESITGNLSRRLDAPEVRVRSLVRDADRLREAGDYSQAERLYLDAVALGETRLGRESIDLAGILNNLAVLYKLTGRFEQASALYRKALCILEAAAADPCELATLYHNLGGLEHARGRHNVGEPFARRGIEMRETALGPDSVELASDLVALGALLDGQGKFDQSEPLYHRALKIFERTHGPDHLEIAVTLNNLAALHHARGQFEKAEPLYARVLAMKEKLLGPDHPEVATTLNNVAVFKKARGDRQTAAELYQRALRILERVLSSDHPKLEACRENYHRCIGLRGQPGPPSA